LRRCWRSPSSRSFWSSGPRTCRRPKSADPFAHLDERKAAIYENLRDLQFEYRVGKLSEIDYQKTKHDLQSELAAVLAEVDRVSAALAGRTPDDRSRRCALAPVKPESTGLVCPSCGAKFEKQLKFCGECGKPMKVAKA
jgi:NADH pyrophosphatase NudC (nudix superfamily)